MIHGTTGNGFQAFPERKNAKIRLFCFPYGGGSGSVFRTWSKHLPEDIEVVTFTLPGRGSRLGEENFTSWQPVIDELEKSFSQYLDKPYFFFGHSLGVCIAFELSKRLQARNLRMPLQFFASGCQCPHLPAFESTIHNLPKEQFLERVMKINGIPREILEDDDLMSILETVLRADILLAELWSGTSENKLTIPIKAFSGLSDNEATPEEMCEWGEYTTQADFKLYLFQGDHFFLHHSEECFLKLLLTIIQPYLNEIQAIGNPEFSATVLANLNKTTTPYPQNKSIAELFEEQVNKNPSAIALIYQNEQLTYGILNKQANQLAHNLIKFGVTTNMLVGICLDRSFDMIISLLAILKAGGAYFPLDQTYPQERLTFMLSDANVSIILTTAIISKNLPAIHDIHFVLLDQIWSTLSKDSSSNIVSKAHIDTLAYVNYTSGSTGKPKGVETLQRGVIRLVCGANYAHFDANQVFLHVSPISFDAATFEIWGALLHGATCVLLATKLPTIQKLKTTIESTKITTLFLTTALFNTIIDENSHILSSVKQIFTGGEANSVIHMQKALKKLPNTEITSVYGPTESTTFATYYPVKYISQSATSIPIGRPINNTEVYVLDEKREIVEIGTVGELYIGGDGLAKGYLNQPELTSEKFPSNFSFLPQQKRLYRTGDRVCYLADGNLDFVGRIDDQVKIRGFRIELGEVESTLIAHPSISQAAVVVHHHSYDDKNLIAYLIPSTEVKPSSKELLGYLHKKLPQYMAPSAFYWLDTFPLTPNGKINRKELISLYSNSIIDGQKA